MANINTESIAGFKDMTPEQQVEALLKVEVPDQVDLSGYVKKSVFDAKAAEASDLSKKLKGKMTEDEQKAAEAAEKAEADAKEKEALLARVAELEKNNTLREYTMSFHALGLDEKLAADTATAMADGKTETVFANLKKFLEDYEKSIEKKLMDKTPNPGGSSGKDEEDAAIKKAKALYGKANGTAQTYTDVLGHYKK
jgi:hypothetical protein